jgi:3-methylfumaryl-CoA hydratase
MLAFAQTLLKSPMSQPELDLTLLKQWIGRSETHADLIHAGAANALAAVFNLPPVYQAGSVLPPLWHWIYFWSVSPQAALGEDGHPQRGGFLPPVPLPRRMWAGGRLRFHAPILTGSLATRTSRILDVNAKTGSSGRLAFVTVAHEIAVDGKLAIHEEHDIVYRDNPQPGALAAPAKMAPHTARWSRQVTPDPVLLFRYSALTFNGHRIHYDRSYVTQVEGYPGLIVHGPLIASLLVDLLREHLPDNTLEAFSFRAVGPLFDIEPFSIHAEPDADGRTVRLWAANARGELAMQAEATLTIASQE